MARAADDVDGKLRMTLLLRSQVPLLASIVILLGVAFALGVEVPSPTWLIIGLEIVALPAVAALVLPWERMTPRAQWVLAVVDLIGITILASALHGALDHLGFLAAFPAVWLTMVAGVVGAVVGVIGAYLAALVPVLVSPGAVGPADWASALVPPVVVMVLEAATVMLAGQARRSTEGMQRALDERNRAAAESERVGAVMRSFADEIDLGVVYFDAEGAEPFYNQAILQFGELAHYDGAAGAGLLVYQEDQVTPIPPEEQVTARMRRGEDIVDVVYWVGPRGNQRALLANGRPVRRPDGRVTGSMLVVQDITEPLRTERSREDALATLAHELRTPLTSILGYADLLASDGLPAAASARVDVIARNADHLLRLTTGFLEGLHRPPELRRERARLRDLVAASVEVLQATPGFAERELRVQVDPALEVVADRAGILTVLNNLLHNAIKFSRPGDHIRVDAGQGDGQVWLSVHDSGPAIDRAELERIFDRFYRGTLAQRDAIPGTGIGLSVSRDIVTAHGGSLTAEPVDEGACFRLTLPRSD